ncbi:S1 RNA-binding domain-containing protein [Picosynechococcus sp. PCC 73109]|uniref:S1 RNA-binding domain-containing protein n=1 Tax=Picosynechococcus sp. PCC 73109 TaxID=374982 RepID=UPI0007459394|nr:S1 RNA-binding domain-containing protein [Picosynechococcus sp. PCC 73109]AMA09938.1 30S ribosomal protein S1 [Picosynechococcus sp. PCC 73109]
MTAEPNPAIAFSMDDFEHALTEHDYHFEQGQVVTGKIFEHLSDGVLVDIGGKSPGFSPLRDALLAGETDAHTALPVGETVEFLIVRGQNAEGQVTLSRRKLAEQRVWEDLAQAAEAGNSVQMRVTGSNRGGVTGDVQGLRGFIPNSHLVDKNIDNLMGQLLTVNFLEFDQERRKLVLSQRYAAQAEVMRRLSIGALVSGTVVNIKPYGVFIELDGMTGLLHRSQISAKPVDQLEALFSIGQTVRVLITDIEENNNRISLSLQALEKFPGEVIEQFDTVQTNAEERVEAARKKLNLV